MRKLNFLIIFSLILSIFFFSSCDDNFYSTVSNSDNEDAVFDEPTIGPEEQDDTLFSDDGMYVEYNSSIRDGETGVEVNKPLQITFEQDVDHKSVTPTTFYLKNADDTILYFRIIRDDKRFTLIPRIPLQPGRTYTVVMKGIKNLQGKMLKPIEISYTNRDLDFGLYWYGKNGLCEKYFPGIENAFYNDEKKSIIFAHGVETGKIKQVDPYGRRGFNHESFFYKEDNFKTSNQYNGLRTFINHSWIDDDWNTGIVFWTQFADELNLWGVEAKIWTFDGPSGANYKFLSTSGKIENKKWDRNLIFKGEKIFIKNVTHLLSLYVVDSLKNNFSGIIRFAGHSLGNQVVCRLAEECFKNNIIIERVALLDPAWTAYDKNYLVDGNNNKKMWVGEKCRKILFNLIDMPGRKFAVEIYNTTGLSYGAPVMDNNAPLRRKVCDVNVLPWYYDGTQIEQKHVSAYIHYFWSYASSPPKECVKVLGICTQKGIGPSASTPTERIMEMMTDKYKWTQIEGVYSPDPGDDIFERKKK